MKILVCISHVPDTTSKINFTNDNTAFDPNGVQFVINPNDEFGLTRAIWLKQKDGATVTVATVGDASCEAILRKCLAIGADSAIRIEAKPEDGFYVATQLAAYAQKEAFDLIITGRESIDYNGGMVQGLIAGILDLPIINVVTELEYKEDLIEANRDIDGGVETVSSSLPCVVSAQKDLCEPRIPNMRGIMMARSKPLTVIEPNGDFNYTQVEKYELPEAKTGVKLIDAENAESLIDILHNEEKLF